jgi:hypothetical protein
MFIKGPGKKKSRADYIDPGRSHFHPLDHIYLWPRRYIQKLSGRFSDFRIILLAAPSHLHKADSDMLRFSSPVTAAGPSPILTGFPFALNIEHLIKIKKYIIYFFL